MKAETSHDGASRDSIIKLLNDSLATELVCVLRYKRHQFVADSLAMPKIANADAISRSTTDDPTSHQLGRQDPMRWRSRFV